MAIDVVIACIDKDLPILRFCIQAARLFIEDGVDQIFIVAPDSPGIKQVAQAERCEFIDENAVFELRRSDVSCPVNGVDRSGWIFKQLLVLCADRVSSKNSILVLDADTVLIRPHRFLFHEKVTYFVSDELHAPYYDAYRKILKMPWRFPMSFVSHYMLFERRRLEALRADIARENNCQWYDAIVSLGKETNDISFFSEYETYGNYCLFKYPDDCLIQYCNNLAMSRSLIPDINRMINKYQNSHRAFSFHTYIPSDL